MVLLVLLLFLFTFVTQFNSINGLCECTNCTNISTLKTNWYSVIKSKKPFQLYEKKCESADYYIQIDHLTFGTYNHTGTFYQTWKLLIKTTKNSKDVYNNLSTINLPSSSKKAVECFHLPTQPDRSACRPIILPISSIYIAIECLNKWFNCRLQYRIEIRCVRHRNIPKRNTWDVRVDKKNKPTSNVIIQTTQNRIQIRSKGQIGGDDIFPSTVYVVYYEPIYSDRNDSWILTINALSVESRIYSLAASHTKVIFGFITDQFPINGTEENGWRSYSNVLSTFGTWIMKHTGYYCIDEDTRRWSGTLAGDDEHYLFTMYLVDLTEKDVIKIDIAKVTNAETMINVFKNNQTTSIQNYLLEIPIPKARVYPVIGFNINGTVTIQRAKHQ